MPDRAPSLDEALRLQGGQRKSAPSLDEAIGQQEQQRETFKSFRQDDPDTVANTRDILGTPAAVRATIAPAPDDTAKRRRNFIAKESAKPLEADGEIGRAGYKLWQRIRGLGAGGGRAVEAGLEELGLDPNGDAATWLRDKSTAAEVYASRPVTGEQTWQDLKKNPTVGGLAKFVLENGASSLADMGVLASGVGLPAYVGLQAGSIGQQRAVNNADETAEATGADVIKALPAATASALLERLGVHGIFGASARTVVGRIAQAGGTEALTEAIQSPIEYAGSNLGTEKGFDVSEAIDQAAAGAVAGGFTGAALRGSIETPSAAARLLRRKPGRSLTAPGQNQAGSAASIDPDLGPNTDYMADAATGGVRKFRTAREAGTYATSNKLGDRYNVVATPDGAYALKGAPSAAHTPGIVETAEAEAANLTPEDIDSPIPNETIIAGREELARAGAAPTADAALKAAGLPTTGARVTVNMGNGRTATGTMADMFEHTDPDLGTAQGVRVALDDGTTFEEFLSAMSRGGMSVAEMNITPEEVIAGAQRQLDAATAPSAGKSVSDLPTSVLGPVTSVAIDAPTNPDTGGKRLTLHPEEIAALREHGVQIDDDGNIDAANVELLLDERSLRNGMRKGGQSGKPAPTAESRAANRAEAAARRAARGSGATGRGVDPEIVGYLTANGIPNDVASGIAAGVAAESGNDHNARNPSSGALGLGQWLGPRQAELRRRYGDNPTRQQQMEYLLYELRGGDAGGKAVLKSKTADEALDNYVRKFMRPAAGAETDGDLSRGASALRAGGAGGAGVAAVPASPTQMADEGEPASAPADTESVAARVERLTGRKIGGQDEASSPNPVAADPNKPVTLGASVVQLTDKSVVVRNTTEEQMAAIRAALPAKVQPVENKRAGGMVFAAKHAAAIRAAIDATPAATVAPAASPAPAVAPASTGKIEIGAALTDDQRSILDQARAGYGAKTAGFANAAELLKTGVIRTAAQADFISRMQGRYGAKAGATASGLPSPWQMTESGEPVNMADPDVRSAMPAAPAPAPSKQDQLKARMAAKSGELRMADYAGKIINSDDATEAADYPYKGGTKEAFHKDATAYLSSVAKQLAADEFQPRPDRKGKPGKAVSVNRGGVAVSGEVNLSLARPDGTGVFVQISQSSMAGKRGFDIRATRSTSEDPYGSRGGNQWLDTNLTAAELAAKLRQIARIDAPASKREQDEKSARIKEGFAKNREAMKRFKKGDIVEYTAPGTYRRADGSTYEGREVRGRITDIQSKEQGTFRVDEESGAWATVEARNLRPAAEVVAEPAPEPRPRVQDRSTATIIDPAAGTMTTRPAGNQVRTPRIVAGMTFRSDRDISYASADTDYEVVTVDRNGRVHLRNPVTGSGTSLAPYEIANAIRAGATIDVNSAPTPTAAISEDQAMLAAFADMRKSYSENLRLGVERMDSNPERQREILRRAEVGPIPDGDLLQMSSPRWLLERGFVDVIVQGDGRVGVLNAAGRAKIAELDGAQPEASTQEALRNSEVNSDPAPQPEENPSTYGADNKLVSRDRAAELRQKLREKMRQLNSRIDPEALAMFTELGVFHIEAGARRFADFAKAVVADLGVTYQKARPFLRSAYNDARDMMEDHGLPVGGMDSADQVRIEMAAMFREGGIGMQEEANGGLQDGIRDGDARPGAEAIQQPAEDGGAGRAGAEGERAGAPDAGRPDERARQVAERPTSRPASVERSGAAGDVNADRISAREPAARRGRGADPEPASAQRVAGQNWRIEPGSLDEARGAAVKARDNLRAIEIIKAVDADQRLATSEEQAALARYVGWGGLKNAFPRADGTFATGFDTIGPRLRDLLTDEEYETARRSIQYAHYTSEKVVRPMWDAALRLGFEGGKVFEPGMGTGNFLGMMPAEVAAKTQYQGIEYDATTARIAQLLYPQSGVRQDDYTRMAMPADTFDLVIGNPPFSETVIRSDPAYREKGFVLHDFFFAKSLDAVRPGGLLMFVTSAGTMNKSGAKAREYLADRADLVGAIRLPGNAFAENAGTSVTTDIVVLRKRLPGEAPAADARQWVDTVNKELPNRQGQAVTVSVNSWFDAHPDMVLGEQGAFDKLVSGDRYAVRARPGANIEQDLRQALANLPANVMQPWHSDVGATSIDFLSTERKSGSFYIGSDGALMQQRGAGGVPVQNRGKGVEGGIPAKDQERIRALIPVRDALREVYGHDMAGNVAAGDAARAKLNTSYEAFVKEHGPINKATISYQRPSVIQQETARAAAREEARLAGGFFNEGTFDATPLMADNAKASQIAQARKAAREMAAAMGREFDEGDFNPAEMPDNVIIRRPNIDPFMDDQEAYRLRAIEHYNDDTGEAHKSAVFFENVITKEREPEINSAGDAFLYVLNRTGRVDLDEIAQRAGVARGEIVAQLGDSIFEMPGSAGTWQTREQYLSGNVRQKLVVAQEEARRDPQFERNVRALEAVQPADLSPAEIGANLGMPWIPAEVIEQFGRDHMGLGSLKVTYLPGLAQWQVDGDRNSVAATTTWGMSDRSAPLLVSDALNRTDPKVTKTVYDENGRPKQELDPVATQAAQDKVREIKQAFSDWVWKDADRADRLATIYNRDFNNLVAPEYDGAYLTTPGISSAWSWRPHQKRVVARIIQAGNTYMAHAVGAGKTSAMIGAGMEMRRLGLVRKPAYVVPNHMLGQFTKEFYEQYPTAKIAVADERQFHTDRRKQFVANIAGEDLDAVIITHSAFGYIPISDEFSNGLIQKQIDDYRALVAEIKASGGGDRFTQRRIEQAVESLEQKLEGRAGGKKRDQVFTFEETGIDFLFVDEAHLFRKLDFATKMGSVRGVDPSGSQMAFDLYAKTRYLEGKTPGRSHVLASGTPITNTMAELYSLSRYQQEQALQERGIAHFDAWAGAYGDTVTALEQDPAGGYKPQTRFAKFVNVPELSAMVRQIMDVVTSKQLEQYVTRPKLKNGRRELVAVDPSSELVAFQETLKRRMAAIQQRKGPPKKGDDILLSVIGDGRKAAIDMRLVDAGIASNEKSKLDVMIDRVVSIGEASKRQPFHKPGNDGYSEKPVDYGPATQMIFSDLGINGDFPIHKYIANELTRRGFAKSEVAIISDFRTHVARQRLFNDMNEGKVRVLIGSVAKMGTGVNAQKRLLALHNMDPQWYPANDEQRNGRALRQGNMNPEIEIVDYSTVGTYDSTMWGLMETKARFIEGFMAGDATLRSMDDLGEASQYEQAKALTTSDPRILQLTEMRQDLERAERRADAFDREQYAIRRRINRAEDQIDHAEKRIPDIEADIAQRQEIAGDSFAGTVMGQSFDDRAEFGAAVLERMDAIAQNGVRARNAKVGEVAGFPLVADAMRMEGKVGVRLFLNRNGGEQIAISSGSAAGISTSVASAIRKFEGELEQQRAYIEDGRKTIAEFTPQLDRQFEGRGEIDRLTSAVGNLESEISKDSAADAAATAASIPEAAKESRSPEDMDVDVDDMLDRDTQAAIRTALEQRLRESGIADRAMIQAANSLFADRRVRGSYQMGIIRIALDVAPDPIHTLDHEIVHALRDMGLFRPDEWRALERAAGLDAMLMADIRRRYPELDAEGQAEEAVAEMYANYRRTGEAPQGMVVAAMRRIVLFFRALREVFTGNGDQRVRDAGKAILDQIAAGQMGEREASADPRITIKRAAKFSQSEYAFDEETEKRFQEARKGVADQRGFIERVKESAGHIAQGFTRHFAALPNTAEYSDLRQQLRKLEAAPQASRERVVRVLTRMVEGLSKSEYDLFSRKVILDDLAFEADEGRDLPFGFTEQTLAAEKARIDAASLANDKVTNAIRQRKLTNDRLSDEMVSAGILTADQVKNPSYYRHQVLEYARLQQSVARAGSSSARLRTPHWARRKGSALDINANLLEAEFDWMQKAFTDIETAKTIDWVKASRHNVREDLIRQAKDTNRQNLDEALRRDEQTNGRDGEVVTAYRQFRQKIAMSMSGLRSVIEDGTLTGIPANLQGAADAIVTGQRGGEPPFGLLSWILDNGKPGAMSAGAVLKAIGERRAWTKSVLGDRYLDPMDVETLVKRIGPADHVTWQPEEGKLLFTAKTIPEHVIDGMIAKLTASPGVDGAVFADILSKARSTLIVGGDKYQMVLPREVAETLNQLRDPQTQGLLDEMVQVPLRAWKRWVLVNPRRVLKYNINNLSGDLDAVIAGNPRLLRHVGVAARELATVMRGKAQPSARYQEAVDRGVFDSGISIQEIPEINSLSAFTRLAEQPSLSKSAMAPLSAAWRGLQGFTQWRENVFRYAAYLNYAQRLEAGEDMKTVGYGASIPAMVDAVADAKDRAAMLARDLVGDYGDVSANGRYLRSRILPFYSWLEVNTRRYWRLSRNAYGQGLGRGIATSGGLALAAGARRSAWLAIRMGMFFAAVSLWNNLFHGDEEDKLSDEQQRQMHVILGTWDGEIVTLRTQGAMSDALSWFGYADVAGAMSEIEKGRGGYLDVVKAVAKAPVNKVVSGLTPLITQPLQAATGQSTWPDAFNARPIRDGWRNFYSTFSMENEYDLVKGRPTRGYARSWIDGVTYSRDPGEIAYDASRGQVYKWLEREKGQEGSNSSSTPRSNALYDYRRALRFGDDEAADRALDKMGELGMTEKDLAASIKRAAPLGPIAKKDRAAFVESLSDDEFKKLEAAQAWYESVYK